MPKDNRIIIHHQDGTCPFNVANIKLSVKDGKLDLEIETHENEDCVLGFLPSPTLYVENTEVTARTLAELTREELDVPIGWNTDDNIFRIYIGQHQALDHNKVTIRRRNPTEIEIDWKSDAVDFNYYDERARRNVIEAHCVYIVE
ncbi:MAG: hypothetical protein AAF215_20100 [Cyanobacteria bacterium P01_A01_bin.123]